jgi:CHASE2 domain-containing sensor protein
MNKLVTLKLEGDFETGFFAHLTIAEEEKPPSVDLSGKLPPALEILDLYQNWCSLYRLLYQVKSSRIKSVAEQKSNFNLSQIIKDCGEQAEKLSGLLNDWLLSRSFLPLRDKCLEQLNLGDEIRFLIRTSHRTLQKLPWHQWELIERYNRAEVAISSLDSEQKELFKTTINETNKVNILAILGNSEGINIEKDREILQQLPNAKIQFLVEPNRQEMNEQLWEKSWDILFFSGHSQTEEQKGQIHINATDSLSIKDLKYGLKKAIKQGLQLAIFNSCDGLGLAWELQELFIPQAIVMSEPVPDYVAQQFLKYFLQKFATGGSLYQSVGEARKQLHGLEDKYPCASWLPIICQNAAAIPPTWSSFQNINLENINESISNPTGQPVSQHSVEVPALIRSLVIVAAVIGLRSLGLLQGAELFAYDLLMRLRPDEAIDDRLLVVEITEDDIQYQRQQGWEMKWSQSDRAISGVLQKLQSHQPRAIGLDIYRDFPVAEDEPALKTLLAQSNNIFAVCKGSDPINNEKGVAPPPEISKARIGFSDTVVDNDGILRRYLWSASFNSDSPCTTEIALSLQLALHYLEAKNIPIASIPEKSQLKIGNAILKHWQFPAAGYQKADDFGYQMLLNYRTRQGRGLARHISLKDVLNDNFDPSWVKDKIIIIGITAESVNDEFITPFSHQPDRAMKGVYVQAQMVSQIISAVEDGRPLLSVWSFWGEVVWIFSWAAVGSLIAWQCRKIQDLILAETTAAIALLGISYLFFLQGWWIPLVPPVLVLIFTGGWVIVL